MSCTHSFRDLCHSDLGIIGEIPPRLSAAVVTLIGNLFCRSGAKAMVLTNPGAKPLDFTQGCSCCLSDFPEYFLPERMRCTQEWELVEKSVEIESQPSHRKLEKSVGLTI
jgi:hypothetical protein